MSVVPPRPREPWLRRLMDPEGGAPFEVRMLRMCSLLAVVATVGFVIPVNLFLDLPVEVALTAAGLGLAALLVHVASRRGRHLFFFFCGAVIVALNILWFFNYGADGSVIYWFFVAGGIMTVVLRGRSRAVGLGLLVLDGAALLLTDYLWPDLANRSESAGERTLDLVSGFVTALVTGLAACRATVDEYRREGRELERLNAELEQTLAEVRTLQGLLPICGWCKKIRADDGAWTAIERYLTAHADVSFTHGICPTCLQRHFPEGEPGDEPQSSL